MTSSGFVTTSATVGNEPASIAPATSAITPMFSCRMSSLLSPGSGVVPGGDDDDVFAIDRIESEAAHFDLREQGPCMHEVEREALRVAGVAAVDRARDSPDLA